MSMVDRSEVSVFSIAKPFLRVVIALLFGLTTGCSGSGGFSAVDETQYETTGVLPDPAIAQLVATSIDLTAFVVEGVEQDDIRQGPGWHPETAGIGSAGNTAISGHRTDNGGPFRRIDELMPGDLIYLDLPEGRFTYRVADQPDGLGHFLVEPSEIWVLDDQGDSMLTLTSCHPAGSCRLRIIVQALLVDASLETAP